METETEPKSVVLSPWANAPEHTYMLPSLLDFLLLSPVWSLMLNSLFYFIFHLFYFISIFFNPSAGGRNQI